MVARAMKIAFLFQPTNTLSPHKPEGSIAIWTHEVTRRLARHCDVIVYAKKGDTQKAFERYQGVQYRRMSVDVDEKFAYAARAVDKRLLRFRSFKRPLFASSFYYLFYALQVAKDLKSEKCDVIHIHNFSQFVPIIRAHNPKIKIALHMHCEWLTQLDPRMIRKRLREADLIMGCSQYITNKIRYRFPQFAERCQTVYNGFDATTISGNNSPRAPKKKDIKQLLYVGRVSPEKGVHVLLDAFRKVVANYPETHLKIVGANESLPIEFLVGLSDDPMVSGLSLYYHGNYFSHLQGKLGPSAIRHVSFVGSVPSSQMIDFYRDADVLVLPSVCSEPFGMPLVEAMAAKVPVVASRVGGITEVVKAGETGLLVERGDASALAEAIIRLLSDDDLRLSMGEAAHKRAGELFSWERIVERLLRLYKNTCVGND